MKKIQFILLVVMAALYSVTALAQTKTKADAVSEIFTLVNKHRTQVGLKPLKMVTVISTEAARHSRDMASGKTAFGHDGFDKRFDKLTTAIKNGTSMAENVAYSTGSPARVVDNWLQSPGHKKNIEGDYTLTGIGLAKAADGQVYYTQIFLKDR